MVDRCGECLDGALDTSLPAYSLLTDAPPGRLSALWEWVPCDFITGNVRVKQQDGSTEWWVGLRSWTASPGGRGYHRRRPARAVLLRLLAPEGVSPIDRTCVIHSGDQTITVTLNPYGNTEIQDTGKQFATPTTTPTEPAHTPEPTSAPTSTPTITLQRPRLHKPLSPLLCRMTL